MLKVETGVVALESSELFQSVWEDEDEDEDERGKTEEELSEITCKL